MVSFGIHISLTRIVLPSGILDAHCEVEPLYTLQRFTFFKFWKSISRCMPVHRFHIKWISAYLFQSIKTRLSQMCFYKINSVVQAPKLNILVHALLELSACYSSIPTSQSGKGSQLAKHLKHELRRASQNAPATAASDELEKSALAQRKYFNSFSSGS